MISEQERKAAEVLTALGIKAPPIDVFAILREEKIEPCPSSTDSDFSGRLEYHRDLRRFLLFYPDVFNARHDVRIRFSVAHELGHYYLEEHRALLISGTAHSSIPGFVCEKQMEIEADSFASGLLIPERTLKGRLSTSRRFLTLSDILRLAEDCESSRESAAIRYVKYAEEKCAVVVSKNQQVLYSVSSDDAERVKFFIKRGTTVPATSTASRALGESGIIEGEIAGNSWCSWTAIKTLFEESISLGRSGVVLTLLAYSKL